MTTQTRAPTTKRQARWSAIAGPALLATLAIAAACEPPADASRPPAIDAVDNVEAVSLLGESLFAGDDTTGAVMQADAALAADPGNIELLLAAAAARANVWRYREAIDLYTHGMTVAPDDWRLYRFRGHRYISTRRFAEATADLERAVELSPKSFDSAYHLGLAYFLLGRFRLAADAYARCQAQAAAEDAPGDAVAQQEAGLRSCSRIAVDPATRVAMTDWHYRALLRAGRTEEAAVLLETIEPGWELSSNTAYYRNLLYYKGILAEVDILESGGEAERFETRAFGVANRLLAEGDTARAEPLLRRIAEDAHWPGFGRIAAEVELARLNARSP